MTHLAPSKIVCALLIALVALLVTTGSVWADSYGRVPIPQLVGEPESIVIAAVRERTAESCTVEVKEVVFGKPIAAMTFHSKRYTSVPDEAGIYFWGGSGSCQREPLEKMPEIRAAIEMRTTPEKYINEAEVAYRPDFIELLGWIFRDHEVVGKVTRKAAIDHLRSILKANDPALVVLAIRVLRIMEAKESFAVIPLLQHADADIRVAAAGYLAAEPHPAALAPLCAILDRLPNSKLRHGPIGEVLRKLDDPRAVPALERAARRGVCMSAALGRLGTKQSFPILLEALFKYDSSDTIDGLRDLVRRSNLPVESWMNEVVWTESTGVSHKQDWLNWWKQHYTEFEIIKTGKEALGPM